MSKVSSRLQYFCVHLSLAGEQPFIDKLWPIQGVSEYPLCMSTIKDVSELISQDPVTKIKVAPHREMVY